MSSTRTAAIAATRRRRRGGSAPAAPLADVATLNTALGSTLFAVYDVRHGLTPGAVSSWLDFLGNAPAAAQAAGAKQPNFDGTTVNFDGTDDVLLTTAIAGFDLSASRSMAVIGAVNGSGATKYAALIRNAAVDRFLGILADTTNITGRHADSAGTFTQATTVAKGTAIRCSVIKERHSTRALNTRVYAPVAITAPAPTGTVAVENKLLEIGGLDGAALYSTSQLRAVLISTNTFWTAPLLDIINVWAQTYHGSVDA